MVFFPFSRLVADCRFPSNKYFGKFTKNYNNMFKFLDRSVNNAKTALETEKSETVRASFWRKSCRNGKYSHREN